MLKQILFLGAAAVSFPALAQQTAPAPGSDNSLAPTEQVAQPTAGQPVTKPNSTAQTTAPAAATPATAPQVEAIVEQEFPVHDSNSDGQLSAAEFTAWMTKLRAAAPQQAQAGDHAAWAAQAFKVADADKSSGVSKAELITFLTRGA